MEKDTFDEMLEKLNTVLEKRRVANKQKQETPSFQEAFNEIMENLAKCPTISKMIKSMGNEEEDDDEEDEEKNERVVLRVREIEGGLVVGFLRDVNLYYAIKIFGFVWLAIQDSYDIDKDIKEGMNDVMKHLVKCIADREKLKSTLKD